MNYGLHASPELRDLFAADPFPHQGQDPYKSKIIVLGLDANYSPEISADPPFFRHVVEYHEDGVAFWKKYGVHHPFLLPNYPLKKNTGGVPYHRRFSWMKLGQEHASHVSFLELLDRPTTGRTEWKSFWSLFNVDHARHIDDLVNTGGPRLILVSQSLVSRYMRHARKEHSVFAWLPREFALGQLDRVGKTIIWGAPHFSSTTYEKTVFEEVGDTIRQFCENGAVGSSAEPPVYRSSGKS